MFSQLLSRVVRVRRPFTTRAASYDAYPTAYSTRQTRPPSAYRNLDVQPNIVTWSDHQIGRAIENTTERTPEAIWKESSIRSLYQLQQIKIADAYQGRSVRVKNGNFAEAVRDLDKILARNQVRATLYATSRHEKKGVKRRRLQSEQWRKHFAAEVRKNVQMVHSIRRRGA